MGNVYEMFWDCGQCGTTELLGKSHRHCPACGAPQDASARYFPPEHKKVAVHNHVYHGVDLNCAHCQTPNSAAALFCINCGAPIGDGDDERALTISPLNNSPQTPNTPKSNDPHNVVLTPVVPYSDDDTPDEDDTRFVDSPLHNPSNGSGTRRVIPRRLRIRTDTKVADLLAAIPLLQKFKRYYARSKKKFLSIVAICIAILGSIVYTVVEHWTYSAVVQVSAHSWKRSITIEEYASVSKSSWCDSTPSDAYRISRSRKQRDTKRIKTGEDCSTRNVDNGDGTFSQERVCTPTYREEPIYDDWCSYTVDRWIYKSTAASGGSGLDEAPYWPPTDVTNCDSLGCTREGSQSQTYTVHYKEHDKNRAQKCNFDQNRWANTPLQSRWDAEVRVLLGTVKCNSLRPIR